jgi:uncharacterized protein (TIGR02300 family)
MIDKEKFGDKRQCPACGCKFYDMHRNPPTCPKCGADASIKLVPSPKPLPTDDFPHEEVETPPPETIEEEIPEGEEPIDEASFEE